MPKYCVKDVFTVIFYNEVEADDRDTALFKAWDSLSWLLTEIERRGREKGITVKGKSKDSEVWEISDA